MNDGRPRLTLLAVFVAASFAYGATLAALLPVVMPLPEPGWAADSLATAFLIAHAKQGLGALLAAVIPSLILVLGMPSSALRLAVTAGLSVAVLATWSALFDPDLWWSGWLDLLKVGGALPLMTWGMGRALRIERGADEGG